LNGFGIFRKCFETVSETEQNRFLYRPVSQDVLSEEEIPQDGMGTMTMSEERRMAIAKEMASLQGEVDDLRKLVNTLLTIIMEEADGVHSGAAPMPPGAPRAGISM
tara:strand:- start:2177 stop:2494 length:318 start_codon:yes stop_codon:yes gene_type:complete